MARFPDGARVCFVGDSITHNNRFLSHIVEYYRRHFPEAGVEFYNCGISGGTLGTTLAVFDEDILPFRPTHAVLMIGINDSARTNLNSRNPARYDRLQEAFVRYGENLERFCRRLKETGTELILCTPSPYAEYVESNEVPLRGGSALMLGYSQYIKNFAARGGYPLCDYHGTLTRLLIQSDEALYLPDRVHPSAEGHYQMARCFLEFQSLTPDGRELSEEVLAWDKIVAELRHVVATEHFILHDDFSLPHPQRIKAIADFAEHPWESPHQEYFISLAKGYPERKKRWEENLRFVIDFMKRPKERKSL